MYFRDRLHWLVGWSVNNGWDTFDPPAGFMAGYREDANLSQAPQSSLDSDQVIVHHGPRINEEAVDSIFPQGEQGLPGASGQDGPPGPIVRHTFVHSWSGSMV